MLSSRFSMEAHPSVRQAAAAGYQTSRAAVANGAGCPRVHSQCAVPHGELLQSSHSYSCAPR
eukprot:CAMPEP_0184383454 /NCGR_PEP_ID=MMETSP0007-20130409/7156_1 /TAXON_ID=97485 /ORGANISM="Prymnesium parvum, Strain Texoma1" /LENGTH=61 /DNA_ID=CAMNT_0026729941 /DNA_START=126 /DNA_END=308 /DNA_ORIENTATION=-